MAGWGAGTETRSRPRAPARLSPRVAYDLMSRHIKRAQKHKIKTVHLRAIFRGKKYKNNKHVHVMIFASSVYIYDRARAHTHTHTYIHSHTHTHTTHTRLCTHIDTYMMMHIYTNTQYSVRSHMGKKLTGARPRDRSIGLFFTILFV